MITAINDHWRMWLRSSNIRRKHERLETRPTGMSKQKPGERVKGKTGGELNVKSSVCEQRPEREMGGWGKGELVRAGREFSAAGQRLGASQAAGVGRAVAHSKGDFRRKNPGLCLGPGVSSGILAEDRRGSLNPDKGGSWGGS